MIIKRPQSIRLFRMHSRATLCPGLGISSKLLPGSLLLILTAIAGPSAAQAPADGVDILNFAAQIEPDFEAGSVQGSVTVALGSIDARARELRLDAGELEIESVSENEAPVAFEKTGTRLRIDLATDHPDNARRITIDYHGKPTRGIRFSRDEVQFSTVFATSHWMPSLDAPDVRATFDLTLFLPPGIKVVGSGDFVAEQRLDDGRVESRWTLREPRPAYTYGFAAGRLREVIDSTGATELRYLASPSFSDADIRRIFADTAGMLAFFEEKAGIAYPGMTYTQVLLHDASAQEMSGFAVFDNSYGEAVLGDPTAVWLAAHEAAHQWWGNGVTNKSWNHFWLNEGVASFMAAAYIESRFGHDKYMEYIEASRNLYEDVVARGNDKPLVFPDWDSPTSDDRILVYRKGAYVVHLLRRELGDENFWQALRAMTQEYWGRSIDTAAFKAAMEKHAGRDLSDFFDKWVYGPSMPTGR